MFSSGRSRISRGRATPLVGVKSYYLVNFFPKNIIKMKKIGLREGWCVSLNPPMFSIMSVCHSVHREWGHVAITHDTLVVTIQRPPSLSWPQPFPTDMGPHCAGIPWTLPFSNMGPHCTGTLHTYYEARMVGKRALRILVECFLVGYIFHFLHSIPPRFLKFRSGAVQNHPA